MIPQGFLNSLCFTEPSQRRSAAAIAIAVSMINLCSKGTGQMSADVPITKRILKILLPTMLPIAIPAFPRFAAVTDVTSSGREVPSATIVRPIKRSLIQFL